MNNYATTTQTDASTTVTIYRPEIYYGDFLLVSAVVLIFVSFVPLSVIWGRFNTKTKIPISRL
jgi:hypothetical protein